MKRALASALICSTLLLGGCATTGQLGSITTTIDNAVGVVKQTKVNNKAVYIAINSFNAAESLATRYLQLPLCDGVLKVCRALGAAEALERPFNAGIIARNDLRTWMKANKGTLADAGLYNTLVSATNTLKQVMAVYGIGA